MTKARLLILFAMIFMGGTSHAFATCAVSKKTDIQYGVGRVSGGTTIPLYLDAYIPTTCDGTAVTQPLPPILVVHGGGFRTGDKGDDHRGATEGNMGELATRLASHGYAAFSMNYRMMGDRPVSEKLSQAQFAAISAKIMGEKIAQKKGDIKIFLNIIAVEDALKAHDFINKNSHTYNIQPNNWGMIGGSAGAATVLGLAYGSDDLFGTPQNISGVVSLWGNTAAAFLDRGEPPMLLVHGTQDTNVPIETVISLEQHAKSLGIDATLLSYPGLGHILKPSNIYAAKAEGHTTTAFDDVVSFFDKTLR